MRAPHRTGSQVRIGVAIAIPAPYSERLTRARIDSGDPEALAIPPHITLIPPTAVEATELPDVREHLREVAHQLSPFVVELSGTETFRPISPVVFVALRQGWDACVRMQSAVNSGPLEQQLRFPYHPHVTIAHELDDTRLDSAASSCADFEATFPVAQFALYEYGDDSVWRDVEIFTTTHRGDGLQA